MTQIYEGMFVLDNQVVREGWNDAKAVVTGTLEKHGGTVLSARRFDERRLAYPINGRRRGTYLLAYYHLPAESVSAMRRDFDLSEKVLRYLELGVDEVAAGEHELSLAEQAADFVAPEPPPDDAPEPEAAEPEDEERPARARGRGPAEAQEPPAAEPPAAEPPAAEPPAAEPPAAEPPAAVEPAAETPEVVEPAPSAEGAEAPAEAAATEKEEG